MLFDKDFRTEDRLFDRCYTRVEEDKEWTKKFVFENTNLTTKKYGSIARMSYMNF